MEISVLVRYAVVFLLLAVTIGTNLEDNVISRIGINSNYIYVIAAALLGSALTAGRNSFAIAAIVIFSLNANMPSEFSLNLGFDRDYYTGLTLALVFQPMVSWAID